MSICYFCWFGVGPISTASENGEKIIFRVANNQIEDPVTVHITDRD